MAIQSQLCDYPGTRSLSIVSLRTGNANKIRKIPYDLSVSDKKNTQETNILENKHLQSETFLTILIFAVQINLVFSFCRN